MSFRFTGGIGGRSSVGRARASQSHSATNRRQSRAGNPHSQAKSVASPSRGFAPVGGGRFGIRSESGGSA